MGCENPECTCDEIPDGCYVGNNRCDECGKPFVYVGDVIGNIKDLICQCKIIKEVKPVGMVGWICPCCGRGNSPFTDTCACQPLPAPQVTYTI